jgi:hypothetical protein
MYVVLLQGRREVAGRGYRRVSGEFSKQMDGVIRNDETITLALGAETVRVDRMGIADSPTGPPWCTGPLTEALTVKPGQVVQFKAGALSIRMQDDD